MISHAIFASSHPTSPAPQCLPLRLPPRTSLHISPRASLHIPPGTPTRHSTLHPTLRSPAPTPRFAPHLALHSHPTPHHALHPAPRPPFSSLSLSQVSSSSRPPISHPRFSILRVPQPSPFTPYFTPHPIMHFTLRTDPIPHHPFPSHFFAPQDSFSQVPPSTSLQLPPISHPRLSIPPCSSAKSRLRIFSCVKRPGSLTT